MGLTLTNKNQYGVPQAVGGGLYIVPFTCLFDNSYPTGGESLTPANLGLPSGVKFNWLQMQPTSGYLFEYDYANSKIKVFTPIRKFTGTFDAASLNAVTARDESITVTGVLSTDEVHGWRGPDALESKYLLKGARASGADTITGRADNPSAASIDPASGTYTFYVAGANGAAKEIPDTTDLSAVTARGLAFAAVIA